MNEHGHPGYDRPLRHHERQMLTVRVVIENAEGTVLGQASMRTEVVTDLRAGGDDNAKAKIQSVGNFLTGQAWHDIRVLEEK